MQMDSEVENSNAAVNDCGSSPPPKWPILCWVWRGVKLYSMQSGAPVS